MITLILLAVFAINQGKSQSVEWPALDEFHQVLAFTYHPMADENNFEPIKNKSGELYHAAVNLKKSKLPAGIVKKDEVKEAVKSLMAATRELDELITAGTTDEIIKEKLGKIHDLFHSIEHKTSEQ